VPDRLRIKAPLFQSRLEAWPLSDLGIERQADRGVRSAAAAQIGDVEPGGLLRADRHHGQI